MEREYASFVSEPLVDIWSAWWWKHKANTIMNQASAQKANEPRDLETLQPGSRQLGTANGDHKSSCSSC